MPENFDMDIDTPAAEPMIDLTAIEKEVGHSDRSEKCLRSCQYT